MGYCVELLEPTTKERIQFDFVHQIRGGTYAIGGSDEAYMSVTYNYGGILRKVIGEKGIRTIYGMSGAESIPVLEYAISKLDNDVDEDYWKATEGNTKKALQGLLAFAKLRPDGIWDGD